MAELRQRMESPLPLRDFAEPGVGPAKLAKRLGLMENPRGCYVLLDGGRPVNVGILKRVLTRLQEHVRGTDHFTATLAYRIAAFRHPHGKTAATAMRDEDFRSRFEESQRQLQELSVAFVAIENPLVLYLFEPYCALDLDTGFEAGGRRRPGVGRSLPSAPEVEHLRRPGRAAMDSYPSGSLGHRDAPALMFTPCA